MAVIVYQHALKDIDGSQLVCWLERKLRVGDRLTLKEIPDRPWIVLAAYNTPVERQSLHKPWRVGGL